MTYKETLKNFINFLRVNGIEATLDRASYTFGGEKNKSFAPVCIKLPLFNYDDIKKTDFFENQVNYDLSICRTHDQKIDKDIVLVTVLLKDIYSDTVCEESEFKNILNKIKNLKQRFLAH